MLFLRQNWQLRVNGWQGKQVRDTGVKEVLSPPLSLKYQWWSLRCQVSIFYPSLFSLSVLQLCWYRRQTWAIILPERLSVLWGIKGGEKMHFIFLVKIVIFFFNVATQYYCIILHAFKGTSLIELVNFLGPSVRLFHTQCTRNYVVKSGNFYKCHNTVQT